MSKDNPMDEHMTAAERGVTADKPWAARGKTLLLEPDTMATARAEFWRGFNERFPMYGQRMGREMARDVWDIAWGAAIAAQSYVQEGRTRPR